MLRRVSLAATMVVMIMAEVLLSLALPVKVLAAQTTNVTGDALKVSPVRWDVDIDPGTTKVIDLFVQNLTDVTVKLHPAINDFVASDSEDGAPKVILDEDKSAPSRSFKKFAKPLSDFTLLAHETKNIKATIVVPKDAAGGGYFGAIRFSPASDGDAGKNVNLTASIGTLVLLRVNGDITEKLSVTNFDVRKKTSDKSIPDKPAKLFTDNKNLHVVMRFNNEGNVQVAPFGTIIIKKGGKKVDQITVNNTSPRPLVLPESTRRFEADLNKLGSFGKYTLEASFGYGTSGQLLTTTTSFYIVPVVMIVSLVAVIVFLVLAFIMVPRMIRGYNRRVIRRATGRRR